MPLPATGMSEHDILTALAAKREHDARWQEGRTFGLVFDGGTEVREVADKVATMFLHENALNTAAFPSLGQIQSEVVEACVDLFHGAPDAAGFMTSGGTESVLMAVKAARDRARAERGVTEPEMIVAESAHAAFHKGAHYFDVRVHKVPVRPDYRADADAMAACVNDNTVLVVGSAPQYPQGVIDPIPDLAGIAATVGASMHVDACMGGFVLPFMEMNGEPVAPWDFRVPGVTTISADIHKLGYAPKGASVLIHRDKNLRRYQTFVFDDWLGGMYASPGIQGSRAGLPMATAWAVMHRLGIAGYRRLTRQTIDATRRIVDGVRAIPGLRLLAEPDAHLFAFTSGEIDMFALGDALHRRRWHLDRQKPPDNLHATVSAGNAPIVDEFLHDLRACVAEVGAGRTDDRGTEYATLEYAGNEAAMTTADDNVRAWEAQGRRIDVDGRSIWTLDVAALDERDDLDPILVLHGFPSCSYDWRSVLDTLRAHRRVVAVDFLGFGLSDKPDLRYGMRLQADVVEGVARSLGLTSVAMLTHDMGDTVGGELLARSLEGTLPFEITRRVLTNGSIYIDMAQLTNGQKMLLSLDDAPTDLVVAEGYKAGLAGTFSANSAVGDDELDAQWLFAAHNGGQRLLSRTIRYIEDRRAEERRFTGAIEQHPSPLAVVWGADDPIAVLAMTDELVRARPGTPVTVLDGVGHYPMIEAPARFATAVAAAL